MSNRLIIQLYRGTTAQNDAYVGAAGELTIDTTRKTLRVHDGITAGGTELAKLSETLSELEAQALIDTGLITCANVNGSATEDFSVKVLQTANGILPTTVGQDIGSATNRFNAIYVDEAYLSTNTLYIGDTPIIGTTADTILIKADLDQSINIRTTGSGETTLQSQRGITLTTSGPNADVEVIASGVGARARFTAEQEIDFTAPETTFYGDAVFHNNQSIIGNLTVTGNVTVNGDSFIVNASTVQTEDNLIFINNGELGSGVTKGTAGIEIDRGSLSNYQIIFDESVDLFKVGQIDQLEVLATREWVATQTSGAAHTHTEATTSVSGFFSAADKTKLNGIESGATADQTKTEIDALGINAATVNGKTVLVNVPVNAVFTDTVYDDSGIIGVLNTKVTAVAGKGLSTEDFSTVEKTKLSGIEANAQVNTVTSVAGKTGVVSLAKADVGLGNVDNTTDLSKPISTLTQTALDGKAGTAHSHTFTSLTSKPSTLAGYGITDAVASSTRAVADGVATLDSGGKLTSTQIPAVAITNTFVVASDAAMLALSSATIGDIAVRTDLKKSYILTSSVYNEFASWQVLLTPTDVVTSVAGRVGDVVLAKYDVGLSAVDDTSDLSKPVSNAQQTALNLKLDRSSVVDSLVSDVPTVPLSANQGRVLKAAIDTIQAAILSDDTSLDQLQEVVNYIKLNRSTLEALGISGIAGLQTALDQKVTVVSGKGLSTEDYTTAEKTKLAGVATGAQVNTVTSVAGQTGVVVLSKSDVGLGNVDNVSQATMDARYWLKGPMDLGTLP